VPGVGVRIERQLDGPIVRQVDAAPAGVAEHHAGWPDTSAGLREVLADAPFIAEVEFPAEIEQRPLAGGGGACGRRGQRQRPREVRDQQGQDEDDAEAEAEAEETVHCGGCSELSIPDLGVSGVAAFP
jgi:hypothetical protein